MQGATPEKLTEPTLKATPEATGATEAMVAMLVTTWASEAIHVKDPLPYFVFEDACSCRLRQIQSFC